MATLSKAKTKAYHLLHAWDYDFYKRSEFKVLEFSEEFGTITFILIKTCTGTLISFDYDIMESTWKFRNLNGESMVYQK